MSKITDCDTPRRDDASVERGLARLLETPSLARVVPHLPAETLHQLIRQCGLDACSELVAFASPAQLTAVLDLDLWRHARPGGDQRFDVDRFGEWIDMLVDSDSASAARTVAALDESLVVAGLSRHVRVLDPGIFEPTAQSDDEQTERHEVMREGDSAHVDDGRADGSGVGSAECEIGGYVVRARRADRWDAIIALLVALDTEQQAFFHAVMRGCRSLSNSRSEIDGLDNLLPAPEQHLHDVAIEREHRQSRQGYVSAADARAFLEMARQKHVRSEASISTNAPIAANPIVAAYFRGTDEAAESFNEVAADTETSNAPDSLEAVLSLLAEAGVMPARPPALLEGAVAQPAVAEPPRLQRLMAYLRDSHETAYFARRRELAFLANTLVAGGSVQARAFTPREASDAAAAICNLGLEHWPARWPHATSGAAANQVPPEWFLVHHDLVSAFEAGWLVLHEDVGLFAATQLIQVVADLECVDRDMRRELDALRRTLVKARDAGTPWRARDAAEMLSMLDLTAWCGVLGLLDECPVLPAALTAVLQGRLGPVDPAEFDFISTAAQIADIRTFVQKLPDILSR